MISTRGLVHDAQLMLRRLASHASALVADRRGNFGVTFALISVPVLLAVGCSFDYVVAYNTHRKMQSDLDAALVAAVKSVGTKDEAALKAEIHNWLEAEAEQKLYYVLDTDKIQINRDEATIVATVNAAVPTTIMRIAGHDTIPIAATSGVAGGETISKTAFSMYLVLDRSGSMAESTNTTYTYKCGYKTCSAKYTKMEALQIAVHQLTDQLTVADPDKKYVRTAAVSYDDKTDTPAGFAWGVQHVKDYVDDLYPRALTDSSGPMAKAYAALTDKSAGKDETKIHQQKNNVADPKKYIVFMTDGANTKYVNGWTLDNPEADEKTRKTCDKARKDGITIYSVAFMAPQRGQNLLKYCATTPDDYFVAENTAQLVEAFKTIGETASKNPVRLTQ